MTHCGKIGAILLLALAGCATNSPQSQPPETINLTEEAVVVAEPAPIVLPKPVAPVRAPLVATNPVPAPIVVIVPTNQPTEGWIPLDRWSQMNGFGALKRLSADAMPIFAVTTTNGTMTVRVGSQSAHWNGLEYRLGFAPQLISGLPYIHTLDVRKNFDPLLHNTSLHFKTNRIIVIDPGHGGMDTGTKSVYNARFEKEFTLDWAFRLQALLVTNGWTVLLTRSNDMNLALSNRVAFAERNKADLFLSLHFNSAGPDKTQAGLETYCLTPTGMPSNLTRGFADNTALIFPNNSFDKENLAYAVRLHRALLNVNGHADRGVRRARFLGVLQNQNRPAALVEGGYLSNPYEAKNIADPNYRQRLAEAIAQALLMDTDSRMNLASQSAPVPAPAPASASGKIN
ncbi:MAG: N-acetylmuramoyl-L-alanine amidase [Pedosphaera sp.]|nr:N-acetylmuramoyl-L-alanine amidase [Pedosphaera sp.]